MIPEKQLLEIKSHLEDSQNPLFLFDNDVDGLCAYAILRRALGRGKGVAIKSYPDLKEQYLKKVDEFNPDAVIVLDKADISQEFINGLEEKNIPLIWIDHHETKTEPSLIKKTHYVNSLPSAEPTTYIAQSIFSRKEDEWIAMIGCIGDVFHPPFAHTFGKEYPELYNSSLPAFDALHATEIGNMVRMLNFGLMDTITNVVNLTKFLIQSKGPYDLLEENHHTYTFHKRYAELNTFYKKQVEKAEKADPSSPIILFTYSGDTSMSSEIANRLYYNHKEKLIVVAYQRPDKINVSIRGKNALHITKELTKNIPGSTGGGHAEATGAMIPPLAFDNFKEYIQTLKNSLQNLK